MTMAEIKAEAPKKGQDGLGKELALHGLIYALTNMISRAVGFIMIPVYTRALSPAQYGIIELLDTSFSILALLAGQRVSGAILRYYFDSEDPLRRKRIVSSGILSCLALTVLLALLLQPVSPYLAKAIFGNAEYGVYIQLNLVSFVGNFMVNLVYTYIRILKKSVLFLVFSVSGLVLALSLNILFIVHMGMGVYGVLCSAMITSWTLGLGLLAYTFRHVGFGWDWPVIKSMYRYTFPLILGSLWSMAEDFLSRYFIRTFTSLAEVGLYSLSYKFGVINNFLVTGPFFNIWNVKCWELARLPDGPERMARVFTIFNFIALASGLAVSVPAREIIGLVADARFSASADFIPVLILANILLSQFYFFTFGMQWAKKTRYIGTISWIVGATTIGLDWLLIRRFGLWGASAAMLSAAVLRNVLSFTSGQRLFHIPYQYRSLSVLYAFAVLTFTAGRVADFHAFIPNLAYHACVVAAFPSVLLAAGFFEVSEVAQAKAWTRKLTGRK
jgi:O-antigen/teichoic acid export membrane protein